VSFHGHGGKDLILARREEEDEVVGEQALLRQKWANYTRVDDMSASGGAALRLVSKHTLARRHPVWWLTLICAQ